MGWHVDLNDIVLDRVNHQVSNRVKAELPHDVAAMSFDGFRAQVEQRGDLFRALPFRQQLRDLTLSRSQCRESGRFIS